MQAHRPMLSPSLKARAAAALRSVLAGRPARSAAHLSIAREGPLVVAGLFRTASGVGESARRCADALEGHGLEVRRCDLSDAFRQADLPPDARLAAFPEGPAGTLILHLNAPETAKALLSLGYGRGRRWRVIGYWAWELETLPGDWRGAARHLTEIWTPSEFCAGAIRKSVALPVRVAPHYVAAPAAIRADPFRAGLPGGAVVSLVMGDSRSSLDRKNLLGGVKAFLRGVGDDPNSWLIVKMRNFASDGPFHASLLKEIKAHPRIRVIDQSVSEEEKWSLVGACDIFLSLHRSEGFGLVIAEAMALGKAVIATGWSGNMEFMTEAASCVVPYELISVRDQAGVYRNAGGGQRWAEPDLDFAAEALKRLSADRAMREALGEQGRELVRSRLDGSQYLNWLGRDGALSA